MPLLAQDFFSAALYYARCKPHPATVPSTFSGLAWETLRAASVSIPGAFFVDRTLPQEPDDGWLLFFQEGPRKRRYEAECHAGSSLTLPLCLPCHTCLSSPTPRLPPTSLANGNWIGSIPPVLADLTETELLFIARGFSFLRLKQLRATGDPRARQRGLQTGTIAFPQNSAPLFDVLMHTPTAVADYIAVQFTGEDYQLCRSHDSLSVRRHSVAAALHWLRDHNPVYADIQLSDTALAELPIDGVPAALLPFDDALSPLHHLQGRAPFHILHIHFSRLSGPAHYFFPGPAQAASSSIEQLDTLFSATILDPTADAFPILRAWDSFTEATSAATEALHGSPPEPHSAAASARAVTSSAGALQRAVATSQLPEDPATFMDNAQEPFVALIPHSSTPLDSYDSSFWSACHPLHFPYGLGAHGGARRVPLTDEAWAKHLVCRVDRTGATSWSRDLSFLAVLYSTLHRRRLLRAIRLRLDSPSWKQTVADLAALQSTDFLRVYQALTSPIPRPTPSTSNAAIPAKLQQLLHSLRVVQSSVPGTDGARLAIRQQLTALHYWLGFPVPCLHLIHAVPTFVDLCIAFSRLACSYQVIFCTLNPADILHPFTLYFHTTADSSPEHLALPALSHALHERLRSESLSRIVAEDPLAATRAFYQHVRAFAGTLLSCVSDASALPLDNLASLGQHGIFGPIAAFFGAVEPQLRGSLHIHMVLYIYGFNNPQSLVQRFSETWPSLEKSLSSWIDSITQSSVESVAAFWASDPAVALASLQPLPYTDQQIHDTDEIFHDHIGLATHGWHAAAPATDYIPSEGPWPNPFCVDEPDAADTFVPFALDYLTWSAEASWADYTSCLLFDLRHSLVACALHSCRPQACFKGWLGQRGYCRLGFWHWQDISASGTFLVSMPFSFLPAASQRLRANKFPVNSFPYKLLFPPSCFSVPLPSTGTAESPHTWVRRRGQELCPLPRIQNRFPNLGAFCTQRHHHWLTRFNTSILLSRPLACISCLSFSFTPLSPSAAHLQEMQPRRAMSVALACHTW